MNTPIHTISYHNYTIRIYHDDCAPDPVKDCGCICGEPGCNGRICQAEDHAFWLNGEVYGYETILDGQNLDSCWGFYGDPNYAIESAKELIDFLCRQELNDLAAYAAIMAL
jgi:hypothetical protein